MNPDNLADRLREEIEAADGGITGVSRRLGKARATIYNWCEAGNIPANQLVRLEELGVDVWYVLTGERSDWSKRLADLSPEEQWLVAAYRQTGAGGREVLEAVGRFVEGDGEKKG